MWWEPRALRLIYIQSDSTYPGMGTSSLMTKYDKKWDTVVPDPSLVSALPNPGSDWLRPIPYQIRSMSYFNVLLDRNLQHTVL